MPFLPLAAGDDAVAAVLADLAIILLAAKLGDELFRRLRQPPLIGEILAGIVVGPSVLGLIELTETLQVFAELGVVFLLFWVGLETRLSDMREVGPSAALIGLTGVMVPFAAGIGAGLAFGESTATSVFLGAALAATSVGITSAVFADLGILASRAARTVLGAAVIDDILALLLVAIAVGIAESGGVDFGSIAVSTGLALAFVAVFAVGGSELLKRRPRALEAPRFAQSSLIPAVIICLGIAALAAGIGLAAVIGAFLAGMIVAETREVTTIERDVEPLYAFFPPFFFAVIGLQVDLDALADSETLLLVLGLSALAIVSKFLGAVAGAGRLSPRDRLTVAIGMIPRGEVGIIVAGIGASEGVIEAQLFAAIVAMSIVTTLVAPPALRRISVPHRPAIGPAGEP